MYKKIIGSEVCIFLTGGAVYCIIELLFRKRTHYSMFILGGLCVVFIDLLCNRWSYLKNRALFLKALVGGFVITTAELITGAVVNLWLGLGIWDYSHLLWNLAGQICPLFTAFWVVLSVPAIYASRLIDKLLKQKLKKAM